MEIYIQSLILHLRVFAFVSIVGAVAIDWIIYRDSNRIFARIIYVAVLIALIANYDTILKTGTSIFDEMKLSAQNTTNGAIADINATLAEAAKDATWFERKITIPIATCFLSIGKFFAWVSSFVQEMLQVIFRCAAPIVLSLAAWRALQSTGIRFAVATLWLCMWNIGTAIADLLLSKVLLASLGKAVLSTGGNAAAATAAAAATGGSAPMALIPFIIQAAAIVLISAILFYVLTPIMLYHIMSGGDIVQAATHALGGAIGAGAVTLSQVKNGFRDEKRYRENNSGTGGNTTGSNSGTDGNTNIQPNNPSGSAPVVVNNQGHSPAPIYQKVAEFAERQMVNK